MRIIGVVRDETQDLFRGEAGSTAFRLLSTAAALFRERGYAATSTRQLAAALGLQHASLYHHIGKKEDLLYTVCIHALNRIHEAVEEARAAHSTHLERLRAMIRAHVSTALRDRDQHATMLFELRSLSPDRQAHVIELRDRYENLIRTAIGEAQEAGAMRRDLPAKLLGLGLLNLLNWSIFWFKPEGERSPEELADTLATIFLEGAVLRD